MLTLDDIPIIQEWLRELVKPHWGIIEEHIYDWDYNTAYWIRNVRSQEFIQIERDCTLVLSTGMPYAYWFYGLHLADPDVESKIKGYFKWE